LFVLLDESMHVMLEYLTHETSYNSSDIEMVTFNVTSNIDLPKNL